MNRQCRGEQVVPGTHRAALFYFAFTIGAVKLPRFLPYQSPTTTQIPPLLRELAITRSSETGGDWAAVDPGFTLAVY